MEKQKYKRTILIDLDGVLNTYNGSFDVNFIPPLKDGAKEFLEMLNVEFEIKLFTTRNKLLAAKWLCENNLDAVISDITNVKELCWLYIDDRCLKFDGDYSKLCAQISGFKAWYKG